MHHPATENHPEVGAKMESETTDLSKRADKGDKEALRELFALAERLQGAGNLDEAVATYRDAAIAYRISAFRNLARAEEAESKVAWNLKVCALYRSWIKKNANGLRKPPFSVQDISHESVVEAVKALRSDSTFAFHFAYLQTTLEALGVSISSPGSTVWRHVVSLLSCLFGIGGAEDLYKLRSAPLLDEVAVQIALEPIADYVLQRRDKP